MFSSRKIFSIFFLFLSFMAAKAQEGKNSLTVEQSLELALKNYPLAGQRELISRGSELESAILQKQYLPQLNIKGRATYQSEVTAIPLELSENTVPRIDKDHYKVYAEMDQLLFDGGTISNEQDLLGIVQQMQAYELDMKLYPIKNKVNQLFFAVLILRDHIALNKMLEKDVELGLEKVRVAIENGTALRSEGYRLNVSLLKIQQRTIALESSHRSTLSMLASYIGIPIGDDTQLVKPVIPNNLAGEIKRPELYFYDYHIEKYNIQNKLLNKKVIPRLSFFAQGGYGRPTLNLLSNDFSSYYLAGLQLKWSLSEFYTLGKE